MQITAAPRIVLEVEAGDPIVGTTTQGMVGRSSVGPRMGRDAIGDRLLREAMCDALIDSGELALLAIQDGRVVYASRGFQELARCDLQAVRGAPWLDHLHPDDRVRVAAVVDQAQASGQRVRLTCRLRGAAGGERAVQLSGCPAAGLASQAYALVFSPMGGGSVARSARTLPGVALRESDVRAPVLERISTLMFDALMAGDKLAILVMEVRGRDVALPPPLRQKAEQALVERLRPQLRRADVLGRDAENGLLAAVSSPHSYTGAAIAAGRLIDLVREPVQVDGRPLAVDVNVGIAMYPDDDEELGGLLSHARVACQVACENGANMYSLAETALNSALRPCAHDWDPTLEIGIPAVDAEHHRIVDGINTIAHDIGAWAGPAELGRHMDALLQAVCTKFRIEDELMVQRRMREREVHRTHHRALLRNLYYLRRAETRQSCGLATRHLYAWLLEHVRDYDAPLAMAL